MEFTERVLILRVGRFREADLWVRFLSPSRGLLSAFAFGGARSRRRFTGCLDSFNEVLVQVKSSRGGLYLALQEGVLLRGPARLRRDWRRVGPAMNCLKFLEAFGVGTEGAASAYTLFSAVLTLLEDEAPPPELAPVFFRARLAMEQGYALTLDRCARCGKVLAPEKESLFLPAEGVFFCTACSRHTEARKLALRRETLDALAQVLEYTPSAVGDAACEGVTAGTPAAPSAANQVLAAWTRGAPAALSPVGRQECARAVDAFLQYHVGLFWENGRFLRT